MNEDTIEDITSVAEYAEAVEAGGKPLPRAFRRRSTSEPAQVYSIRIPVGLLGELRSIADREGLPPATMVREWVIERIQREVLADSLVATAVPFTSLEDIREGGSVNQSLLTVWHGRSSQGAGQ